MNYRLVLSYLGNFTAANALLMAPSMLCAAIYREWAALESFLYAAGAALLFAALLKLAGRGAPKRFFVREGVAMVAFAWLVIAIVSALPYYFHGVLKPLDAFFESVSGLTTTGSTVIADIEAQAKSILFWRAFTCFIGGMGIVVIFLEVLPYLGAGGRIFLRTESAAPEMRNWSPTVRQTIGVLLKVYVALTLLQTGMMMLAGVSLYESLCTAFATLASAGFHPRQASIAAYDSLTVELIVIFFMIMAGANFGLIFAVARGDWRAPFRDTEWRVYMALLAAYTLLCTADTLGWHGAQSFDPAPHPAPNYTGVPTALRNTLFATVTCATCTGFTTADFDLWPESSHLVLMFAMIAGGCAGSTAGGLKIIRLILLAKMAHAFVVGTFRPRTVIPIRYNGAVMEADTLRAVSRYFMLYLGGFASLVFLLSLDGMPFKTAVSGIAATLSNVGPGLEHLGATEDFSKASDFSTGVFCLSMMLGRLEFLSFLALITPSFWRRA